MAAAMTCGAGASGNAPVGPPPLLEQVRQAAQRQGHHAGTVGRHVAWCRRYILFHQKRHPREMGRQQMGQFLDHVVRTEAKPVDRLEEATITRKNSPKGINCTVSK